MRLNWNDSLSVEVGPLYVEIRRRASGGWEYHIELNDSSCNTLEIGFTDSEAQAKRKAEKWIAELYESLRDALQEDE